MWMYVETKKNNFWKATQFSRAKGSLHVFRKSYYWKNKTEHFFGTACEFVSESSSGHSRIHTAPEQDSAYGAAYAYVFKIFKH